MKKQFLVILVILMAVAIALVGCSSAPAPTSSAPAKPPAPAATTSAPAPAATSAPAPAPATTQAAAPAKIYNLKAATQEPINAHSGILLTDFAKKVDEVTKGRVKITVYPAETLGKTADEVDMVKNGVADIIWIQPNNYKGVFPLSEVASLPYVFPNNRPLDLLNTVYSKFFYKDYQDFKMLWMEYVPATTLHMAKKAVRTMDDLKGAQIRTPGGTYVDTIKALGGTPVSLAAPEVYSSLEKGVVAGCVGSLQMVQSFKLVEVTKYHIFADLGSGTTCALMNQNTWKSLSPDIQQAIDGTLDWAQKYAASLSDGDENAVINEFKARNQEMIYLSADEATKWQKAVEPINTAWTTKVNGSGTVGTDLIKTIYDYRAAHPVK